MAKLTSAETGDTLSDKDKPLLMESWEMPEPLLPVAIAAKSKADEDKMAQALVRLVAEDPTLRLENNAETHQLVLWCMGEAHADLLLDRLTSRYGVGVETVPLRVPLRETFGGKAQGLGRNVKQSGGHGEYGICHVEVEPLPSGERLRVRRQDRRRRGAAAVHPVGGEGRPRRRWSRACWPATRWSTSRSRSYDGKAHSVDSSDMAFQKAGRAALRDAADKAQVLLLEPVDEVSVLVADDYVGAVMSDLSSRRGRVLGTEPVPGGRTLVKAEIPELEITRYAIDLRSMSHGTARSAASYLRHEPLPVAPGRQGRGGGQGRLSQAQASPSAGTGPAGAASAASGVLHSMADSGAAGYAGQAAPAGRRVSPELGQHLGAADDGMKLASPPQRGTTCWCRCPAMPAPATPPMFMPMLKPCATRRLPQRGHGPLGEVGQLGRLLYVQLGVVGHVPVRDHHEMTAVIGIQIEHA